MALAAPEDLLLEMDEVSKANDLKSYADQITSGNVHEDTASCAKNKMNHRNLPELP